MSWEDQGRQHRGWFGHGTTAGQGARPPALSSRWDDRILAVAYGAIGVLPASVRGRVEGQYQHGALSNLQEAMTAWIRGAHLDQATFAGRFLGRAGDDPIALSLRSTAHDVATATRHDDIREAAGNLAGAIKQVGVDQWPRFIAEAATRAHAVSESGAAERITGRYPGSYQSAQAAMGLCALGPAGCVAGAGVTAGQLLLGGAAITAGGAIILDARPPQNHDPITNPPQQPQIPEGWVDTPGRVPGSTVHHPPEGKPNGPDSIRVMPPGSSPVPGLENGYWIRKKNNQPINPATGKPGRSPGEWHVPLPPRPGS